ncbi:hypothetical protein [Rubrivivax sp. JA1026]|uniref:hypothetical protein n=1 Tax=Rubrivivax sp. JA1026 TaxID=2710888 RepID=UPI0013E934E1|nr:hypothetical protein [Rubrivivax sp. JA1026]
MARVLRSALDPDREAQALAADAADRESDAALWRRLHSMPTGELEHDHPAVRQAEEDCAIGPLGRAAIAAALVLAIAASAAWPWGFATGVAP